MSGSASPSANTSVEYDAIAATIGATERGRWFLAEHARRTRGAETEVLLGAISRLERTVTADRGHEAFGHLRGNLVDMADAISRTKAEIAAISATNTEQTRLTQASLALDAIVRETEQATSDILGSAEAIQEAAWTLRERGADAVACDGLDRHATAIYTACSFQDLTAQRTARIVYTLRYLEDRLSAMIAIWGSDAERIPPLPGAKPTGAEPEPADLCQSDIDRYISMDVPAVTAAALVARPGSPALHEDLVFLPVSGGTEAEPADRGPIDAAVADAVEAAIAGAVAEVVEEACEAALEDASEASEDAVEDAVEDAPAADDVHLDWAALVAAAPEPGALPEAPALTLAEIEDLTPEQRLALFA
jgi:hypothetical protein